MELLESAHHPAATPIDLVPLRAWTHIEEVARAAELHHVATTSVDALQLHLDTPIAIQDKLETATEAGLAHHHRTQEEKICREMICSGESRHEIQEISETLAAGTEMSGIMLVTGIEVMVLLRLLHALRLEGTGTVVRFRSRGVESRRQ